MVDEQTGVTSRIIDYLKVGDRMSIPSFSLENRVAVVSGARRGIGKAIALAFAEAGSHVAVCDCVVEGGELDAVASSIQRLGRRSFAAKVDVSQKVEVDHFVEKVEHDLGAIDIMVNDAGIHSNPSLLETSEDEWRHVIDVNLTGYYLCCQAVGKKMVERKSGSIINIASVAGIHWGWGGWGAYNVAKAGVIMLTKHLAREMGGRNVRVNAIAPSVIKTEMTSRLWEMPEALATEQSKIPLGRLGEVGDLTGAAIFLASEASAYITGHTLIVDGGRLA